MQTKYFKVNKKEYCHITDENIFVTNEKIPTRVPLEYDLSEAWSVKSILNYIFFGLLFIYTAISINYYGVNFFKHIENYGAILLLLLSFVRMKNGFLSSYTPTINRSSIKSVYFKTPFFSFARLVIYFEGPEGKTLRKVIPVLYKKQAESILKELKLI